MAMTALKGPVKRWRGLLDEEDVGDVAVEGVEGREVV